eukprot:jgi/Botrbrau1/19322/Bobra.0073s0054.2
MNRSFSTTTTIQAHHGSCQRTLHSRCFLNFYGSPTFSRPSVLHSSGKVALQGSRCFGRHPIQSRGRRGGRLQVLALQQGEVKVRDGSVTVVLLAGGVGKRMGAPIPKQYLELLGKPIATYSLATFAEMPEVGQIVIVCDPSYRPLFEAACKGLRRVPKISWALPGAERQDSVFNGFQEMDAGAELVAIHDSARPLVLASDVRACFMDALQVGAAVLGVPVKPTIKEVGKDGRVVKTLQRSSLWEVQTPQVIRPPLLSQGFDLVKKENLEVTDDVSIIEALGLPVVVTSGSYTNIKVTTPDDMSVAERFLSESKPAVAATAAAA